MEILISFYQKNKCRQIFRNVYKKFAGTRILHSIEILRWPGKSGKVEYQIAQEPFLLSVGFSLGKVIFTILVCGLLLFLFCYFCASFFRMR